MKNESQTLNRIAEAVATFITIAAFVSATLVIVAFVYQLAAEMIPDAQLFTDVAFFTLALAFALGVSERASKSEAILIQKMVEIDEENDRRDDATSTHIELVYQDVCWLVRREQEREVEQHKSPEFKML